MSGDILRPRLRRRVRDRSGSASAEFAISFSAILSVAVAAADVGALLRGDLALNSGVRDAVRVLSRTPIAQDGLPMAAGVELAEGMVRARLAQAGLTPAPLLPPDGASCSDDRVMCLKVEPVAGSAAALGRARSIVTVWAGAEAKTQFVDQIGRASCRERVFPVV